MRKNLWQQENRLPKPAPSYPALSQDTKAGIAVIGGGLAGLLTAYSLQKGGAQVLLLEAGHIANGASGHNTGKVTSQHGTIYHTLLEKEGHRIAADYYEAAHMGVKWITELVTQHHIPCELTKQDSYLFTQDTEGEKLLWAEHRAYQKLGIPGALVDEIPMGIPVQKALRMDHQYGYNPFAFCHGIAAAFVEAGGTLYEQTRVVGIERGDPSHIHTHKGYTVEASQVVIATGTPCYDGGGLYFSRLEPHRFHLMAWPAPEEVGGACITIDREDSTPSLRLAKSGGKQWLLVGGEEHITGRGEGNAYDHLRVYAAKTLGLGEPTYQWSAQDNTTPDQLPYLGRLHGDAGSLFLLAGFNLWGNSWSAAGAHILSNLILHGGDHLSETFAPSRPGSFLNMEFVKENLQIASAYVASKLAATGTDLPQQPGEGRTVSLDGKRYGAYLDHSGQQFVVDITCPHLGCELSWNPDEKSWDCPCHGSRFGYDGRLLDGPATMPLHPKGEGKNHVDPHLSE